MGEPGRERFLRAGLGGSEKVRALEVEIVVITGVLIVISMLVPYWI